MARIDTALSSFRFLPLMFAGGIMFKSMNDQSSLVILMAEQEGIKKSSPDRSTVSVDRLEHLRLEILSGTYHVEAERLADAMLRSQGLSGRPADVGLN